MLRVRGCLAAVLLAAAVELVGASGAGAAPGDVIVADYENAGGTGSIVRVNPSTGARTLISSNATPAGGPDFANPFGLAFDASGNILVADVDCCGGGEGGIIRVNPATGARTLTSSNTSPAGGPSFGEPADIVVESSGNLLVLDGNETLIRVDASTGARTLVSSNASPMGGPDLQNAYAMERTADGSLLVANLLFGAGTASVIRIDPSTGVRTLVSSNASPAGTPAFAGPAGILQLAGGDIVVSDQSAFGGTGGLIRVNPTTGARTTLSENTSPGGGPSFNEPRHVALDAGGNIIVGDVGTASVLRVNASTGARTLLSGNGAPAGGPALATPNGIAVEPGASTPGTQTPAEETPTTTTPTETTPEEDESTDEAALEGTAADVEAVGARSGDELPITGFGVLAPFLAGLWMLASGVTLRTAVRKR